MPETFEKDDNQVNSIPEQERLRLAQKYAKLWRASTDDMRELFDDSEQAWNFVLKNRPDRKDISNGQFKNDAGKRLNQSKKGLRLGTIPKTLDTVVSMEHNATFPVDDRFFKGSPVNDFAREKQEVYEQFLGDNFAEANVSIEFLKLRINAFVDGTACLACPYVVKKNKKTLYERNVFSIGGKEFPIPGLNKLTKKTKEVVEWEGTLPEALDFADWRIDPRAKSMSETWFGRRWYMPTHEVERKFRLRKGSVSTYFDAMEHDETRKHESAGLPDFINSITSSEELEGRQNALLMVFYDDFIIDGELYEKHLMVTLNDEEILFFNENDYDHGEIPYIVTPYKLIPGQVLGMSGLKHAIPSAGVIDTATDLILKNANKDANPIFEVKNNEPAFIGNTEVEFGKTYPVKNLGAIQQVQTNSSAALQSLASIIENAKVDIAEVTNGSPIFSGEAPEDGAPPTAFEVSQRVQGGNSRARIPMFIFNNMAIEPFLKMVHENFRQYKQRDEYVSSTGDTITPDDIKMMDFKWVITSSQANVSRGQELANMKALMFEMIPQLVKAGLAQLKPGVMEFDQNAMFKDFLVKAGMESVDQRVEFIEEPQVGQAGLPGVNGGIPQQPLPGIGQQPGIPAA